MELKQFDLKAFQEEHQEKSYKSDQKRNQYGLVLGTDSMYSSYSTPRNYNTPSRSYE